MSNNRNQQPKDEGEAAITTGAPSAAAPPPTKPKMDHSSDDPEETALRQSLTQLDIQRRSMELEADTIYLELTSPPGEGIEPMGIDTPLVDGDGYPRADINVYRARELRQRFRVLQTDHKQIEAKIQNLLTSLAALKNPNKKEEEEKELEARLVPKPKPKFDPVTGKWVCGNWDGTVAGIRDGDKRRFDNLEQRQVSGLTADDSINLAESTSAFSSLNSSVRSDHGGVAGQGPGGGGGGGGGGIAAVDNIAAALARNATVDGGHRLPFARIDAVARGSPAEAAGLKEEDLIVTFGPIHGGNHNHLKSIQEIVIAASAEKKGITIHIQRHYTDETPTAITLIPRPWNGRGLLGCHIVPYSPKNN